MSGDNLCNTLMLLFAKGDLSATTVRDLATAAWNDGWGRNNPMARKLVQAGFFGRRRGEILTDVIAAAFSEGYVCSKCHPYEVPISTGGTVPVFLPHEFYPAMVAESGHVGLCFSAADLATDHGLPQMLKDWAVHSDVAYDGDLSMVAVLGMHADGVQYNKAIRAGQGRSIYVASMNVVSATSAECRALRQPLWVLRKDRMCDCGCSGYCTIQELMAVVAWSLATKGDKRYKHRMLDPPLRMAVWEQVQGSLWLITPWLGA
jgi:hypothetical protein